MASDAPLIDPAQLARRTGGNVNMQVEMLSLFVAEAERLMHQVDDAPDPLVRGDRLRALIALARNTGAARLAEHARGLETRIAEADPDLTPLREVVEQTLSHVRSFGS